MENLLCTGSIFEKIVWPKYEGTITSKTKNDYATYARQICEFANKDFFSLTQSDAEMFFQMQIESGLKKGTIRTKLSALRSIGNYISSNYQKLGIRPYHNIFNNISAIIIDTYFKEEDIPSLKEIDQVLQACKSNNTLFVIISLVFRCSLTASEVCNLTRDQFVKDTMDRAAITFKGKDKVRIVAVPDDIMELLEPFISSSNKELFKNKWGNTLQLHNLQALLQKTLISTNINKHITLQDIRNASIFYMLRGGANYTEVAKYTNIDGRWLFRYDHRLIEFSDPPCNYMHLKIVP